MAFVVKFRSRPTIVLAGTLVLVVLTLLAGCSFPLPQIQTAPTLFVIPTLTPSITPSLTLFMSPTLTPSVTPTPTETQAPEATVTPVIGTTSTPEGGATVAPAPGSLNIEYFVPTPTEASPGGTVTLAWAASGANQATIFRVNTDGSFGQSWQVDTTGSLTVTAGSGTGTEEKFVLRIGDGVNIRETEAVVTLTCSRNWFFSESPPSTCPSAAAVSTLAAEQEFEHGWAYWVQTTGKIYVLYDDGQQPSWEVYDDTWTTADGETDPSINPPSGLHQPKRGIGKVWRDNTSVRDRLGWAMTSEELGYTSEGFQQEAGADPANVFFAEPGSQVVRLESDGSSWRFGETLP